jgi:hypothetical protein
MEKFRKEISVDEGVSLGWGVDGLRWSARANKEILLSGKNAPFTLARNAEIAVHYVRLFQENNEHVCAGRYSNTSGCIALRNRTHNHATPTPDLGAERYNRR